VFGILIPTMLVGSYPQPSWLVDKPSLLASGPPRVRMRDVWRVEEAFLEEAQDDATLVAICEQERAGIDIVSDGEVRRESYFNRFANALDGIDLDEPATILGRTGKPTLVPRVTGEIARAKPVLVRDVEFLRACTDCRIKITIPGAFTMAKLAADEHYGDQEALIMAYARVVNEEIKDLQEAGADLIQIDEPYMQAYPQDASRFGIAAIDRALDGVSCATAVHLCFGYAYVVRDKPSGYSFLPQLNDCQANAISIEAAQPNLDPKILGQLPDKQIIYGVIDLADQEVETPEKVAARLRDALRYVSAERLIAAPDCGMKYLSRSIARGKLRALTAGAAIVREELRR